MDKLTACCPHALKFGLTAAPIDAEGGAMCEYFVLAGTASYQSVSEHDRCLKNLMSWREAVNAQFIKTMPYDGYSAHVRGLDVSFEGKHGQPHSLPGAMAAIRTAIHDCSSLEERMQKAWPDDWYSPHIMVRCANTALADHLCRQAKGPRRHFHAMTGFR
jgi:hypothetical protein